MNTEDLRKSLQKSNDKFAIFANLDTIRQYNIEDINKLLDLIRNFFSDAEIAKLLELEYFKNSYSRGRVLKLIQDNDVILKLLDNDELMSVFMNFDILDVINSLAPPSKFKLLHNVEFFKKHDIQSWTIIKMISTLPDESRQEIIADKEFLEERLQLRRFEIVGLIETLQTEEIKLKMIDIYEYTGYERINILLTFSDESKRNILLGNVYNLNKDDSIRIISSLSIEQLANFFRDNKEILLQKKIKPYTIIRNLDTEKQLDLMARFEDLGLELEEKRIILATLSQETKEKIDVSNFPPEYVTAMEMQLCDDIKKFWEYGKIIVDLDGDLEKYHGLDEILYINPTNISDEDKSKLLPLLEICPEVPIRDNIGIGLSTAEEYRNAEIWIDSVLQNIDATWSDIQKIAFIDNAIGKKISYTPDFDTEVFDRNGVRALWKIIASGYGVCNGIAQVEKYMLNRIGINSKIVSSGKHAFLKLEGIEMPNTEGGTIVGDTILDPTWNLAAHQYGAIPESFCKSYEETRKNDLNKDGNDSEAHKNDSELASATLNLDKKNLRKIYTSIGIADKYGDFPAKKFIEHAKLLTELFQFSTEEMLDKELLLLSKWNPNFAMCQNSTASILQCVVLNQKNLPMNRCVVNRVYERTDENKRPVLYVYADLGEAGKKFYFADKDKKQFSRLSQEDFEARFECYEMDMAKQNGQRPWNVSEQRESVEDLTKSSRKIVAAEGEER